MAGYSGDDLKYKFPGSDLREGLRKENGHADDISWGRPGGWAQTCDPQSLF
jgi:hypothetical protein